MLNPPVCYIFIGRSGCGKGSQAKLLINYLKRQSPIQSVLYIETGQALRQFITGQSYSSQLSKKVMDQAERQPSFLAIWSWTDQLISKFTGQADLVFDGSPRSLNEAKVMDAALDFYRLDNRHVIHLDISYELAKERLLKRGRADDLKMSDIDKRISWFDSDVQPAIDWYTDNDKYNLLTIDGGRPIDDIHQSIIQSL